MYQLNSKDKRGRLISYYTMAYMLSGQKILNIEGVRFKTVGELAEHIKGLFEISYEEFKRFCYKLVDHNNNLDVSLESWLIAIGKRKELDVWRRVLLE
jgi:hypothetical protein